MRKKILLYLASCCLGLLAGGQPGFAQIRASDYTVTRKAELNLQGETQSYGYTVDQLEGRFNRPLKRFEFRMPLGAVRPVRSPADLLVFKSLFFSNPEAPINPGDFLQLWVYVPDDTRNFDNFRNARTVTLAADLIVNGVTYRTPVAMNLFYSSGTLKYGLDMSMNPSFATASSAAFSGGPLRKLQMLVRESEMNIAAND